jgi:hypothetical protein
MAEKVELIYTPEETFSKPFSIDRHKKTFIDYLEAVIDVNGIVHYAIPSHEQILCKIICEKKGLTNDQLYALAKAAGGLYDWLNWLMDEAECICVYTQGYAYPRHVIISPEQKTMLNRLIRN